MKPGDLVRWARSGRAYFRGHTGIILRLHDVKHGEGSSEGAWIYWFSDEYGPQEAWTPSQCIEVVSGEV